MHNANDTPRVGADASRIAARWGWTVTYQQALADDRHGVLLGLAVYVRSDAVPPGSDTLNAAFSFLSDAVLDGRTDG